MIQLLEFLVEAGLGDHAAELKETVIGVEVFGRPADYDPKIDPVVRKEVRRLRLKLQEYYAGSGAVETTRIDIPKGQYLPEITSGESVTEEAAPKPRPRWILAAAVAVVLLGGSLVAVKMDDRKLVLVPQPLMDNGGDERSPAISHDGKQIAFAWQSPTDREPAIYVQALHGGAPRRVTTQSSYENHPAWSPDAKSIAFVRRTPTGAYAVYTRQMAEGAERVLTEIRAPDHLDWSPDGREIAASDGIAGSPAAIVLLGVTNGGRRQLTVPPPASGDTFPRFSPDGTQLAFLRAVATDVTELYALDMKAGGVPQQLTYENRKVEGYTWAPNGRSLVVSLARGATARSLYRVPLSGGAMERIAAAGTWVSTPEWAVENGALAFVERRTDVNLWRIRTDGAGTQAMVAGSSVLDSSPAFSPDGTRVAFRSDRTGTNEIWVTGLLQNMPRRLTWMNGPLTGSPNWSPDGKWVAFDSRGPGNSNILLAPADGGTPRQLTSGGSNSVIPRWSHDGRWIYFGSNRGGRWQVWKQRPEGGAAEQVTWSGGRAAAESPDGKYLYYTRSTDEAGLFRMLVSGGDEEAILPAFAGKLWGNWAVTADGVYYLDYPEREPSTHSTIRYLDLRTRQNREIYRLPKHPVLWDGGMALSPDGQWLVFAELDYSGSNIQLLEPFK